jgi:hypothetical protein
VETVAMATVSTDKTRAGPAGTVRQPSIGRA